MFRATAICLSILATNVFAQTTLPTSQPTTAPAAATGDPIAPLLAHLNAGRHQELIDAATALHAQLRKDNVRATEPIWVNSTHMLGIARMRIGQWKPAADALQRIYARLPSNRSILINTSMADIENGGDMVPRAARNLQSFAVAHPEDELAVNLWGVALDKLASAGKTAKIDEMTAAYAKADILLEATRPNMRRWGTRWLTQAEFAEIERARRNAQPDVDGWQTQLDNANVELRDAQAAYRVASALPSGASGNNAAEERRKQMERAGRRLRAAQAEVERCTNALNRARSRLPRPTWSLRMEPVDPTLVQ